MEERKTRRTAEKKKFLGVFLYEIKDKDIIDYLEAHKASKKTRVLKKLIREAIRQESLPTVPTTERQVIDAARISIKKLAAILDTKLPD